MSQSVLNEYNLRERVPPHAHDAECAVLGGLMLDSDAYSKIEGVLIPEHFYTEANGLIFSAILALISNKKPFDALMVKDYLQQRDNLDSCGGEAYLGDLISLIPSSANVPHYANEVKARAILREMIRTCAGITGAIYEDPEKKAEDHLDEAEVKILSVAKNFAQNTDSFDNLKDLLKDGFKDLQARYEDQRVVTGLTTGFTDLDTNTAGLQKGDLIIIAGRPSMGKTAFAMNLAQNAVTKNEDKGAVVAIFSLEMSSQQISMRLLAAESKVDMSKMRTGRFVMEDWRKMAAGMSKLSEAALLVDDTPAITVSEVRTKCRRLKKNKGRLDMVLIDYLQLMTGSATAERKDLQISEMTRSLKGLAKELDVPVVVLSQLSRALESRSDRRPMMSDLRESGAIEQDADVIMFIYRDEVYNPKPENEGAAEIIVAKQRNGPTDTIRLTFLKQYTRFENWANSANNGF